MSWKHSGFSIDNSVRILDLQAEQNLAEYIARPPVSLKKIRYEPFKGRVLFHTAYSDYFRENVHLFEALESIAELTQHIPPKGLQLIRRYGLYSSRIRGRWEQLGHISRVAPADWRQQHGQETNVEEEQGFEPLSAAEEVESSEYKQAWARGIGAARLAPISRRSTRLIRSSVPGCMAEQ